VDTGQESAARAETDLVASPSEAIRRVRRNQATPSPVGRTLRSGALRKALGWQADRSVRTTIASIYSRAAPHSQPKHRYGAIGSPLKPNHSVPTHPQKTSR
jgi:hypothetical protein